MNNRLKFKNGSFAIYMLALVLVTVGYWGYLKKETPTLETVSMSENNVDENLGDATLVSNNEVQKEVPTIENTVEKEEESYFKESKLSRDTMYSQTLETYKSMLNNNNVSEEQKAIITQEITKLNKEKNAIMICENLISTKGFENCVIFVNVESVSVIIKSDELKAEEIAQIQNIISREIGAKVENIHIMKRK